MMEEKAIRKYPCRKCLLQEIDIEAYRKTLSTYIDRIEENLKTDQAVYENRLAVCKSCDYLKEGLCGACGCFVEVRAAVNRNVCPYGRGV